jgi:hypothetical protein
VTGAFLGFAGLAPAPRGSPLRGVTALVATHDPVLIDLADEVLQLQDGKITAG